MSNAKQKTTHSNGTKKGASEPKFRFVNYSLTKEDIERLEALDVATEFPPGLDFEAAMEGYKFSLSHDERNHCFVASLTDRVPGSAHQNACLTGRGATPHDAYVSVFYRHLVLASGDWSFFGESEDTPQSRYG